MWSPSPAEWQRLEPLVDELLGVDPAERQAVLDRSFSSDPELRAWALRLIAGADDESFLEGVNPSLVADALEHEIPAMGSRGATGPGSRFGPFRVVRPLGRGGMGQVFLAERVEGTFEQLVAIKIVPGAMVSEAMRRRFLAEQQMLARLDHPNVARLVDGGIRSDGAPWFAMEYVDGTRIDTWCDERRLDVAGRLRLFLSVCNAVQAAHQRLVIHRDLKPANILVDTGGAVRLLDFGVAKLLDADIPTGRELTGVTEWHFTPEYAAPEQWRHAPVSTSTDCWALGVILYQLLAGRRPHDLAAISRETWPDRIMTAPPPPSRVVDDEAAAQRGTSRARLVQQLRGDLDAIVLAALRPDPQDRYGTSRELAEDIQRVLERRPISRRRHSMAYRTTRFVRRNRGLVALGTLASLAIGAGVAGTLWQAREATRAAGEATAVSAFLASMFAQASPLQARGDTLSAQDLLTRATADLDTMFVDRPYLRIRVLLTVAEIQRDGAKLAVADSLARRAMALASALAPRSLDAVAARAMLGDILRARGAFAAADTLLRGAIALARDIGAADTTLGRLHGALGNSYYRQDRFKEAEAAYREALRSGRDLGPLFVATAEGNIAVALADDGRDVAADSFYVRSLASYEAAGLTGHPDYLQALGNRAALLEARWELDTSSAIQARLLPLLQRAYPDGHDRVIIALNNRANGQVLRGYPDSAVSGFREATAMAVRLHDPRHVLAITPRNNLGRALLLAGQAGAAESTFREALRQVRAGVGGAHQLASSSWLGVGRALGAQGRHQAALDALDSAAAIASASLPPSHSRHADIAIARGEVLLGAGRAAEALTVVRRGLAARRQHVDRRSPTVGDAAFLLARILVASPPVRRDPSLTAEVEALGEEARTRFAPIRARAADLARLQDSLRHWRVALESPPR